MVGALKAALRWGAIIPARQPAVGIAIARSLSATPREAPSTAGDPKQTENSSCGSPAEAKPILFHREIKAVIREGHKREKKSLRREGKWIPSWVQGRGDVPDLLISVPVRPLQEDFRGGLFGYQEKGRNKWAGPLYKLRIVTEEGRDAEQPQFDSIRVKAHNMMLNPLTDVVRTITFVYCPEERLSRVRVPIRYINEEKSPGLREGGWLNRLQQNVDIHVDPFTPAPLYATQDVGEMRVKDRKHIGDLQFDGKGKGCNTVLADDTVATMISKV